MGRKVHPMGFRLGVIRDWQAKWYADKHYGEFLHEDLKLRQAIQSKYAEAGISSVDIERQANKVSVTIHTARPGIVIGRGGQRVDEMRLFLENLIGKRIQLNIREIQQPELDAYLVARTVADQMERRIAYRRAVKQAIFRTIQAGAKGVKVSCSGRLGGADIARRHTTHQGRVPLHTLRADIDYGFAEAHTALCRIGVKVWIYKGEILPEPKVVEVEETPAEALVSESVEKAPTAKPEEAPAEPTPPAAAELEEAPAKPAPPAAELEEKPAEPAPPAAAELEEKPAKPAPPAAEKPKKKPAEPAPPAAEKPKKAPAEPAPPAAEKPKRKPAKPVPPAAEKPKRKPAKPVPPAAAELEDKNATT